ncbi:MAG: galactose-1-phosphate uridylyltransferase, partial [Bacilli bacterium]
KYIMYIILRNNRTDKKYPTGIFHAHPEYHHIKKEGIGLIEQMGTFILPARLKTEFDLMKKLYYKGVSAEKMMAEHEKLVKHKDFITKLFKAQPKASEYEKFSRDYMTDVCHNVLSNTACFKDDEDGQKAFERFLIATFR